MAYTIVPVNIAEAFSASQPKITENFSLINTVISVDHVTFDAPGAGKHKQVTFPQQVVDPGVFPLVTSATELQVYSATDGAVPALFFRKESQAVGDAANDINFTTAGLTGAGWCRQPCGLLMNWGVGVANTGTNNVVTFSKAFTNSAPAVGVREPNVFSIQITLYTDANANNFVSVVEGTLRYNQFFARSWTRSGNTSSSNFFYIALGI